MQYEGHFYIDGGWVDPSSDKAIVVVNPATEETIAHVVRGGTDDVDRAVLAARQAFESFSQTSVDERLELLDRIIELYKARSEDLAAVLSSEMGAPRRLATTAQVPAGLGHLITARKVLASYQFDEVRRSSLVTREPIGVCGLITPWNWPLNQISCKVGPAIAAGCTMVLKPSEAAPLNALLFAEILHDAGVPTGVFNLVNGTGADVGAPLSTHREVDMISFTGSTRAGIEVARSAAPTVKRVTQELGGKSANIILDHDDLLRLSLATRSACAPTRVSRATPPPACSCRTRAWRKRLPSPPRPCPPSWSATPPTTEPTSALSCPTCNGSASSGSSRRPSARAPRSRWAVPAGRTGWTRAST
jgi:aldehyde dehydrogenase (NAD+)